jgi:hypothetical protein
LLGGGGTCLDDLAVVGVHQAPVDAHVRNALFDAQFAETTRNKAAQADLGFLRAEPRDLGGEHEVRRREPAFFHLVGLLHPPVFTEFDFVLQHAELRGFEHLKLVELGHFGDEHFGQAFAQRGLPVLDIGAVTAERRDDEAGQRRFLGGNGAARPGGEEGIAAQRNQIWFHVGDARLMHPVRLTGWPATSSDIPR